MRQATHRRGRAEAAPGLSDDADGG
uniref:Uncharacterized protein n=1 Tax=Arundo donax TaxID=35708 RepID=A0A0A9AZJ4_ARUDO